MGIEHEPTEQHFYHWAGNTDHPIDFFLLCGESGLLPGHSHEAIT